MSRQVQRIAIAFALLAGCASDKSDNSADSTAPDDAKAAPPSAAGAAGSASRTMASGSEDGGDEAGAKPDATPGRSGSSTPASPMPKPGDAPSTPTKPAGSSGMSMDPATPLDQIPADCRGFEVRGLKESPGGSTLPNKCAPFDGTLNNPYAIRCVDANPDYKTKFAGDEYCILPPPADKGTQVHVGPKAYDDATEIAPFLLPPGEETNTYFYVNSSNAESHFYYRSNWRMRPGSHHMIISLLGDDRGDGWAGMAEAGTDLGVGGKSFGGAQRTDVDRPQGTLDVPAENVGLGAELVPNQQFSFNLHHINTQQTDILREAWVNIWYKDEAEVTQPMQSLQIMGSPLDVGVNPGERRELHYRCPVQSTTRIISLIGHRHANTDRFGIWIERGGETISAYESFDYTDMPTYQYDSISKNPAPDLQKKIDGGHTGMLELKQGDYVHFVCDITNRTENRLRFANELLTGEMCIVFGSYTGGQVCGPATRVMD